MQPALFAMALSMGLFLAPFSCSAIEADHENNSIATPPRVAFFSDYFLEQASHDVLAITGAERVAFMTLLAACPYTLITDEVSRLRCSLSKQEYLLKYRRNRSIDRLLDAMEFMTTLFKYNVAIGRESEAGIDGRLATIAARLRNALATPPAFTSGRAP
jgi:hypothetical protein